MDFLLPQVFLGQEDFIEAYNCDHVINLSGKEIAKAHNFPLHLDKQHWIDSVNTLFELKDKSVFVTPGILGSSIVLGCLIKLGLNYYRAKEIVKDTYGYKIPYLDYCKEIQSKKLSSEVTIMKKQLLKYNKLMRRHFLRTVKVFSSIKTLKSKYRSVQNMRLKLYKYENAYLRMRKI